MRENYSAEQLRQKANDIRIDIIEEVHSATCGHPGGSLSIADIMSVLYFHELNIDPANPQWEDRDRVVLSKGHAAPALYAVLAERGYFDKEILKTLRKQGSILQGHPDRKHIPGVDVSTGSLGQGISAAVGIALYGKINNKNYRTYAIVGDGEMQEGEVYEALMAAAHYGLSNLTVILDRNGLQIDGKVDDVMSISPVKEKAEAFNFHTIEADGHDVESLIAALDAARADNTKPTFIIAKTVKGKGVSFMENNAGWHGKAPNDEQYAQAIEELTKEAK